MSEQPSGPAILVEGLTKSFGKVHALRGIDCEGVAKTEEAITKSAAAAQASRARDFTGTTAAAATGNPPV